MELRQLQYLMLIADEANFTRAAERLYVSQSALSQQIQKLEQELGTILFDRTGRQLRLTEAGEILYRHAKTIFRELEEAELQIHELGNLERGFLRMGVIQTLNAYLIPPVVRRFKQAYPNLQLAVDELSMDEIEDGLENGELHLGLGFSPTTRPSSEAETLFTERLVLIVAPEHPLAANHSLAMQNLDTELVMLSRRFCTRRLWDTYAAAAKISPTISIEMNTINGILQLLAETNLGTILPELSLALEAGRDLVAIPLYQPSPERQISILWRQGAYRTKAAEAFAALVREISLEQVATIAG